MAIYYWNGNYAKQWSDNKCWSTISPCGFYTVGIPTSADDVVFINCADNATCNIDIPAVCKTVTYHAAYSGNTVFTNSLTVSGDFLVNGVVCSFSGSGNLIFDTSCTIATNNSTPMPNALVLQGTNQTYTLGTNWSFLGVNIFGTTTTTLNGNTLSIRNGGMVVSSSGDLNGTTTLQFVNTSAIGISTNGNSVINNDITINSTGSVTISTPFNYGANGIFTKTAGTIIAPNGDLKSGFNAFCN
tara:strand:+ start:726 stop:1454 length:729 start_codon:yes stop_codon:yes gene_type:complete